MARRYVVLHHRSIPGRVDHFDWMFDAGDCLWTWATARPLRSDRADRADATRLSDHRLDYLQHEGPVSSNRGYVQAMERGLFDITSIVSGQMVLQTRGARMGVLTLYRTWPESSGTKSPEATWRIDFRPTRNEAS